MKLNKYIKIYTCMISLMVLSPNMSYASSKTAVATFAGGCFWSAQHDLESVNGVIKVISGYTGGHVKNPTYEQVSTGTTGHYESVQVTYDPSVISYPQLLMTYWHHIDPTDPDGQFCDKGNEYHSVIFYKNNNEKLAAEESKNELIQSGKFNQIATLILPASEFYPAEEYHQDFPSKNPYVYYSYRSACGRDERLSELWGNNH